MTTPISPDTREDILFSIINRFIGLHSRDAVRHTINDTSREYPFVAMDPRQVFAQIACVAEHLGLDPESPMADPPRFLDIGCGIGNVLLMAEQFGFAVYGIEKDQYPATIAARLIGEDRIDQADIWSYGGFDRFEVVYYFRPFADRELQLRFERLVEDRLRPGAILIANHKNSTAIEQDSRFSRLCPGLPVWIKDDGEAIR
ncbi:MAG: class I SAM-dependent methyltransferase [Thermodesulfobacteriota bacterium]